MIYIFLIVVLLLVLFISIKSINKNKIKNNLVTTKEDKKDSVIINTELPSDFNVSIFENKIKELYINLQEFFSNRKYDDLKDILDDEIYNQYKKEMAREDNNGKRVIRENIKFIDFKINDYSDSDILSIKACIGVNEDKYTMYTTNTNCKPIKYENYYELTVVYKNNKYIINNLKLLCSRLKKDEIK